MKQLKFFTATVLLLILSLTTLIQTQMTSTVATSIVNESYAQLDNLQNLDIVVNTQDITDDQNAQKTETTDSNQAATIIMFTTNDNENPTGEYWPAPQAIILINDEPVNTAAAYIADDEYSNVIEVKTLQDNENLEYLGCFIDPVLQETIHLYGTKDIPIPNDAPDAQDEEDTDEDESAQS